MNKQNRKTHKHRDQTDGCRKERAGGLGGRGEGTKDYKLGITKQSWGVKSSLGGGAGDTAATMGPGGARSSRRTTL